PAISDSLAWVNWKLAIGRPNCSRLTAYSMAVSRQSRAAPRAPQAIPYRASVRQDSGALRPAADGSRARASGVPVRALGQEGQRCLEPGRRRQLRLGRQVDVVEHDLAGRAGPQ